MNRMTGRLGLRISELPRHGIRRWSRVLLLIWAMSGVRTFAADGPVLRLPPCFGDHAVLQRRELDDRDTGTVLWGWCNRGAKVRVRFFQQSKPVDANREYWAPEGGGDLRRWWVPVRDLRAPLQPLSGGEIRVEATSGGRTTEVLLKDIAVGDVWVIGVEPGAPALEPPHAGGEESSKSGTLRWLSADGLAWTNWMGSGPTGGLNTGWSATLEGLPDSVRLLARELSARSDLPAGLVVVNRSRLTGLVTNQNLGAGRAWNASMQRLQAVLPRVNLQLQERFGAVSEAQARAMRQARRRGEVWVPPAGQPESPTLMQLRQLFEGSIAPMGYGVTGFCW